MLHLSGRRERGEGREQEIEREGGRERARESERARGREGERERERARERERDGKLRSSCSSSPHRPDSCNIKVKDDFKQRHFLMPSVLQRCGCHDDRSEVFCLLLGVCTLAN